MNSSEKMKHEVIKQIGERGRLIAEVAQDFGVSNRQVYRWLKGNQATSKKTAKPDPVNAQVAQLKMELYAVSQQLTALKAQVNKQIVNQ
ncbi:transposase [Aliikangiella marina]|nr:transposase [Aliikangiella marina]